jgi:D-glycerate 3-kinase
MVRQGYNAPPMSTDSQERIQEFAASGPAFAQLARFGPIDWAAWQASADRLSQSLAGAADLPRRIHHLYLPVLFFCAGLARTSAKRPLLVGIQAPQGAGKTTLVTHLLAELPKLGLHATGVSIDDFYLTRAEQLELAAGYPGNPYLEHRGYPGTHDVALGERTLDALQGPQGPVRVPVYDKSAHGGRGDRAPESQWREIRGPLDLIFVEGWMLGFSPVDEAALPDPALVEPNRALAAYDRWHRLLDAFVSLRAADPTFVLRWRVEAEEAMKASGKPGLSREAIEDYVRRFLPAYALYGGAPARIPHDRRLEIWLDVQRRAQAPPRA